MKTSRCHQTLAVWILSILLGTFASLPGCNKPPRPNLLFLTLDTTRADHLGFYGYPEPTTPHLDRLAKRGVVFEQARTHVPSTLPSHSTLFTGLLPPTHGVRCNALYELPDAAHTLAEILHERGWATGAVLGGFPLDHRFGVAQGFDTYDDDFSNSAITARHQRGPRRWFGNEYLGWERGADEVTDRGLEWIGRQHEPWFLFAHYFDPHWPYEPPTEQATFANPYDGEIAFTDIHVGRLVESVLERFPRTIVVIAGDHGESLGEHGEPMHNWYVFDATLRVPLLVIADGVARPGSRIATPVGLADVFPTLLELLGIEAPQGLAGLSLVRALAGEAQPPARAMYAETLAQSLEDRKGIEVRAVVDQGRKLIETRYDDGRDPTVELFDLAADPAERVNVSEARPKEVHELLALLRSLDASLTKHALAPEPVRLDPAAVERMRQLGYL